MASTIRQEHSAFSRVMQIMSRKPHPAPKRSGPHAAKGVRGGRNVEQLWAAAAAPNSFWAHILSSR